MSHSGVVSFPIAALPETSSCLRHVSFHWSSSFASVCVAFPLYDSCHHWKQHGTASQTTLDTSSCVSGAVGYHPLVECVPVFPNTEAGDKWAHPAFRNSPCSPHLSSQLCLHLHPKGCPGDSSSGAFLPPRALGFPTSWPAEGVVSVVWPATSHFP